jgi:hypothetical protein
MTIELMWMSMTTPITTATQPSQFGSRVPTAPSLAGYHFGYHPARSSLRTASQKSAKPAQLCGFYEG